jgi:hypothetical protein
VDSKEEASFAIDISTSLDMERRLIVNITMHFWHFVIEVNTTRNFFSNNEVS